MVLFDLILLLILGGFVLYGLWFGLINALGVLVGTIAGAFLAARWYDDVASWLGFLFGGHENLANVVCFLLLFIIINRLVGLVFWIIDKIFSFLKIIPFLSTINRLLGGVFGFLEGVLVLGLTLFVAERYPLGDWFINSLADSKVAHYLIAVGKILMPLLPEVVKQLKSYVI
jgi:membrane protein required for colicin V production